jgi:precorrin-2/cobalt-factor-2 C20-methyltransferase
MIEPMEQSGIGKVICAGLGPGGQDLMSVRADRAVRAARQIAYFRKRGRPGQARSIVEGLLPSGCVEHAMEYPLTTEIPADDPRYVEALEAFYDAWAARIAELTRNGDVVVLCEGDPFFYGSFMHLYVRLKGRVAIEVIPGITGMSGCWNVAGLPAAWGDDVYTVLMGTLDEAALVRHMATSDAIVVMKTGRNLPKVRRALEAAGRLGDAWLIERATMLGERVVRLIERGTEECPYFATVIVAGKARRPQVTE